MIIICAAAFKFGAWRRKRRRAANGSEGVPRPSDANAGEDGEVPLQHFTILSRTASRLSQTQSRYSWIVTDVDELRPRRSSCYQGLEEGGKPRKSEGVAQVEAKAEKV